MKTMKSGKVGQAAAKTPKPVKVLHRVLGVVNDRAWAHLQARVPLNPARQLDARERRRAEKARLLEGDARAIRKIMHMILEMDDPQFSAYNELVALRRAARGRVVTPKALSTGGLHGHH